MEEGRRIGGPAQERRHHVSSKAYYTKKDQKDRQDTPTRPGYRRSAIKPPSRPPSAAPMSSEGQTDSRQAPTGRPCRNCRCRGSSARSLADRADLLQRRRPVADQPWRPFTGGAHSVRSSPGRPRCRRNELARRDVEPVPPPKPTAQIPSFMSATMGRGVGSPPSM